MIPYIILCYTMLYYSILHAITLYRVILLPYTIIVQLLCYKVHKAVAAAAALGGSILRSPLEYAQPTY